MYIGNQRYGPVDFSGTMFVNTREGSNYIGFVFGYQSNRKFYAVMWRHKNLNLDENTYKAGIKGLTLKVSLMGEQFGLIGDAWGLLPRVAVGLKEIAYNSTNL